MDCLLPGMTGEPRRKGPTMAILGSVEMLVPRNVNVGT